MLTCFACTSIQLNPVLLTHVPLIKDRIHLPVAQRELIDEFVSFVLLVLSFLLLFRIVRILILLDLCMDLLSEGIL